MNLPRAIACLPKWADDEPSRYTLECVRLRREQNSVFAEATDGRRLCRLTWRSEGKDCEHRLVAKSLSKSLRAAGATPDGYFAMVGKTVAVFRKNVGNTVDAVEVGPWPKTEDVLHPPAKATVSTVNVRELRDQARVVIKEKVFSPPQMHLTLAGVKVTLDAKYVRDMAETAIQCGYDEVHVSATEKQSAVHFWAYTAVKFESVIMPLAAD